MRDRRSALLSSDASSMEDTVRVTSCTLDSNVCPSRNFPSEGVSRTDTSKESLSSPYTSMMTSSDKPSEDSATSIMSAELKPTPLRSFPRVTAILTITGQKIFGASRIRGSSILASVPTRERRL